MTERFDYVIVGAGPAGCVLANRLSEDPAKRVLLLESGPEDRHPLIHMPKGIGKIRANSAYMWSFDMYRDAESKDERPHISHVVAVLDPVMPDLFEERVRRDQRKGAGDDVVNRNHRQDRL